MTAKQADTGKVAGQKPNTPNGDEANGRSR
jgi:hypothetical protein